MSATCFSAAISSLPPSKTGFVSHGSTRRTFPAGVTILKADWPYHVNCVSMAIRKAKRRGQARAMTRLNVKGPNDECPRNVEIRGTKNAKRESADFELY